MRHTALHAALLLLPCVAVLRAETPCASTVGGAVLIGLGLPANTSPVSGFRVRDVIVDRLLERTFVRVEHCGYPEQPLALVPFASARVLDPSQAAQTDAGRSASVATPAAKPQAADRVGRHAERLVSVGTEIIVTMLDARSNVLVQGHLLNSAAVGSDVDVELAALEGSGMPGRHVRGRLIGERQVEVEP